MASLVITIVRALIVLNLLLLLGLIYVWGRNWWELRSTYALGLALFATILFVENALAAYYFILDPTLSAWIADEQLVPPVAQGAMLFLRAFEFTGLVFLSWVTWD